MKDRILKGIRVVDITLAYSGPVCAMHLADCGADVIKVEPIGGEQTRNWTPMKNGYSGYFAYFNRNKRGIALDMKAEKGKEALMKLIATADVLVENFRVGTLDRLGFSYEEVKKVNPKIIYASVSGFGQEGPESGRATYDIVAQAESGMMSVNGFPKTGPIKIGPSIADSYAGTYLALAISMALYNREKTGEGMQIDVAMVDSMFSALEKGSIEYFLTGKSPDLHMNSVIASAPWEAIEAKDGQFVLAVGTPKHVQLLCEAIGRPELAKDPRFDTFPHRMQHYYGEGGFRSIILEWSMQRTVDEVYDILSGYGLPCGKVKSVGQCAESEQTKMRNMVWEIYDPGFKENFKMPGTPMKFHGYPDEIQKAAPLNGEDNEAILKELGYSDADIAQLRAEGVFN